MVLTSTWSASAKRGAVGGGAQPLQAHRCRRRTRHRAVEVEHPAGRPRFARPRCRNRRAHVPFFAAPMRRRSPAGYVGETSRTSSRSCCRSATMTSRRRRGHRYIDETRSAQTGTSRSPATCPAKGGAAAQQRHDRRAPAGGRSIRSRNFSRSTPQHPTIWRRVSLGWRRSSSSSTDAGIGFARRSRASEENLARCSADVGRGPDRSA